MKIIVCLKQVPDSTEVKIDPQTNTLIREGIDNILNPFDSYALEEAVALTERFGGSVTALSMGPPQAVDILRQALGLGADSACLVSGMEFAGSDTWATAGVLTTAIRALGRFDLIWCGKQAIDGDTAQVGPAIAALLDCPQVTCVKEIISITGVKIRTRSLVENGEVMLETRLPCVLTATKDLNEPRIPTLDGQMRARRAEVPTWGISDLDIKTDHVGLDGSPTRVVRIFPPLTHKVTRRIETPGPATLKEVVDFINKKRTADDT